MNDAPRPDLAWLATPAERVDDPAVVAAARRRAAPSIRIARLVLVLYALTLALIAFWPTPVDSGAGPFLRAITRTVPWLTYDRVEFSANVMLFVPFGVLLALVLALRRVLVMPIALAVTVIIESAQALLLENRTPALSDMVANLLGAAIGLGIVVLFERLRQSRSKRRARRPR